MIGTIGKRFISAALTLVLLLSLLPTCAFASEQKRFALLAMTEDQVVIEPTYITYGGDETLKQALENSDYAFDGIDQGYITAVEGVADNYCLYYDNGAYDINVPADSVSAVYLTTNAEQNFSEKLLDLLKCMAAYRAADSGVQAYSAAQSAYQNAQSGFYNAGASKAADLTAALQAAMDRYASHLAGTKVDLALHITQKGASITPAQVTLQDEFGESITAKNTTQVSLVPGNYKFDVYDGVNAHVRGSIEVAENSVLSAALPAGTWISSVDLSTESGDNWSAVEKSGNAYAVPDFAGSTLYPYILPGAGVNTAEVGVYVAGQETKNSTKRSWKSYNTALLNAVERNALQDGTIVLEARCADGAYEQYETYTLNMVRTPSLSGLQVKASGTTLLRDFAPATHTYDLVTVSDAVSVTPAVLCHDAICRVNGKMADADTPITVALSDCQVTDGVYRLPVAVNANGQETVYTLRIRRQQAVRVTLRHTSDVDVFDGSGTRILPESVAAGQSVYQLIPGMEYTYVTTAATYYHATAAFRAEDGLQIEAQAPDPVDHMTTLAAKSGTAANATVYLGSGAFAAAQHEYEVPVRSDLSGFYLQAIADAGYTVTAMYNGHANGNFARNSYKKDVVTTGFVSMANFLAVSGRGNEMTVRAAKTVGDVTYYQDYLLHTKRLLTFSSMSLANEVTDLKLARNASGFGYDKSITDYAVDVSEKTEKLTLAWKLLSSNKADTGFAVTVCCGDQQVWHDSDVADVETIHSVEVPLDPELSREIITLTAAFDGAISQTYTIAVNKAPAVATTIQTNPADATVFLTDTTSGKRIVSDAEGVYLLDAGMEYCCTVTKNGYVGQEKLFVAGAANTNLTIVLKKAADSALADIETAGDWTNFRADDTNNGVVNAPTPIAAEDAVLTWAKKIGDGYSSGATGCPIIAGGYLYTYADKSIVKMDRHTGEIVATGKMAGSSSFAINSPTYAEGMIFVGLSNGQVQAFDAVTLQSLWLYADPLQGQPNCPITYHDGYIYTGFWNSEEKSANFVCLSVTDEDPAQPDERKLATWTHEDAGFYWAGAYACDDFVLVTTDDGASGYTTGYGKILSLDPRTGFVLDRQTMPNVGDLRSSVCYDAVTNAYYFTSKGGDFYRIRVDADGRFVSGSLKRLHLDNGANDASAPPMSTSTPVIYRGRAYIGVSGVGQFTAYSGHNITVIDLENWCIAYTVPTQGYPQTSGLLTTAYESGQEVVYVYFFDNYTPGKLRVLRDRAGQTEIDHDYSTMETYSKNGTDVTIETGYVLFTPSGEQAQYAICSPVVDCDGNIYFKNDSAQMMCLSSRIVSLSVERQPVKLSYREGDRFDATGMKVVATYANGLRRDVTRDIAYTTQPLTIHDTEIRLRYCVGENQAMYQNQNGNSGVAYTVPGTSVTVQINHVPKTKVTAATLSKNGTITYTCSVCGAATKSADTIYMPKTFSLSTTSYTYNGSVKKPTVTVKDTKGYKLKEGADYTVTYANGRKEVGSYKVTVKGGGKYNFTKTLTFKINPAATKISSITNTSSGITVKWDKVSGATAYKVYRKVGSGDWKLLKTTTATSYTNTGLTNGNKYQYKIVAVKTVNGTNYTSAYSTIRTMYRLTCPTISSATNSGAGKITVKWNKNTKAAGYQIKYVAGTTTKTVKVSGAGTLSKTISKLTKGRTYKVYVRSYQTVSGTTYYSAYSSYKSVKVTK